MIRSAIFWVSVLATSALAQTAPTVAVYPLEINRLPTGVSKADAAAVQSDFIRLVRRAEVQVPDTASLELAWKELKRTDCDREDACLQALAQRAQTLYAVFASIDSTLDGNVVATGRVVRDDGKLVAGPVSSAVPRGGDPFKDIARVALTRLLAQLGLKALPSTRPVTVEAPVATPVVTGPVGPPPPETHTKAPPPVATASSPRRTVGYVTAGAGAAVAIAGAILVGVASAGVSGLPVQEGAIASSAVAKFNSLRAQETAGWVLVGVGVAAAGVGLGLALSAPSSAVSVAPVVGPQGAGVMVQGVFP